MDFMNRGQQTNAGRPSTIFSASPEPEQPTPQRDEPAHKPHDNGGKEDKHNKSGKLGSSFAPHDNKWFRWGGGGIVIIIGILIAAAFTLFITFKPATEADLVEPDLLQAVFLTNDQVYFGDIADVNSKYLVLTNIYYLQTTQAANNSKSAAADNIQLVKLGCELHKPQDRMVIKQDQISFWENLQSDGKVAQAVKAYQDANPNGQTCSTTSPTTNPVQGSTKNQGTQSTDNTQTNTTNNATNPANNDEETTETNTNNNAANQ